MKKFDFKKWLPHIIAIGIFVLLSIAYFSPAVFEGKDLPQGDVTSSLGWGKDLNDYHNKTGEYSFWSNSMFGGMPANYTYAPPMFNIFQTIGAILRLNMSGLHVGLFFLYLLGFYILLMSLNCKSWLGIVGAIALAFASYNLIIIEAGHVNKGLVMATMAPIIGGIILTYRKKYLIGILTTLVFTGVNFYYNHQQISYYLAIIIFIIAVVYFIYAIKEKEIKSFFKSSLILVAVAIIAALPSLGKFITIMDYTKETMRGGAVLTHNAENKKESSGLEMDYAFQWSYGVGETWTLLVPNLYGASSYYDIGTNSECYKVLKNTGQAKAFCKFAPTYWGAQPFTSGPVYAGAIVCFLFVLGLFIVKGKEKWWILAATIISFMLAWGKNLEGFNEFIFNNLPLYNKFRVPSMALVIAGVAMPILAILAIKEIIENIKNNAKEKLLKNFYISGGIIGGVFLIFAVFGGSLFSFTSPSDANYPEWLVTALQADRKSMLINDAWRSFAFVAMAFALIWAFIKYKYKTNVLIISLGALILIDLWVVDRRFLNKESFQPQRKAKAIMPSNIDNIILQDKDPNYRVLNLASNTFNESNTSYFHKSIGGYSPAKLRRYQDIIDFHISKKINMKVLNMLNTKYVILRDNETGSTTFQKNPEALGNAWFVDSIKWVDNPDEEIVALYDFNPEKTAVVDKAWKDKVTNTEDVVVSDSIAEIKLTEYKNPGHLIYQSNNSQNQVAVFSEVYYKTWKAYIDGKEVPLFRANYILRALEIPAGSHKIELKCIDELYIKAQTISKWGSIFTGGVLLLIIILLILKNRKEDNPKTTE